MTILMKTLVNWWFVYRQIWWPTLHLVEQPLSLAIAWLQHILIHGHQLQLQVMHRNITLKQNPIPVEAAMVVIMELRQVYNWNKAIEMSLVNWIGFYFLEFSQWAIFLEGFPGIIRNECFVHSTQFSNSSSQNIWLSLSSTKVSLCQLDIEYCQFNVIGFLELNLQFAPPLRKPILNEKNSQKSGNKLNNNQGVEWWSLEDRKQRRQRRKINWPKNYSQLVQEITLGWCLRAKKPITKWVIEQFFWRKISVQLECLHFFHFSVHFFLVANEQSMDLNSSILWLFRL